MHRARTENQVNLALVKLRDRFLSRSGKRAMASTLPEVRQEMRSPSSTFAQQDDPDNVLTHGTPGRSAWSVVCATTFANLRDFWKAAVRKLEAAAGCEVLPTLTGRCVEIPRRLIHALSLAAASERRTEGPKLVSSNVRASGILKIRSAPEHLSTCSLHPSMTAFTLFFQRTM
jgi:hypothetical protein